MRWAVAVLAMVVVVAEPTSAQSLADARTAFRSGEYRDAEAAYRAVLRADPTMASARRGLAAVLSETGRYEEAERVAAAAPDSITLANTLGEILLMRGETEAAEAAFLRAIEGGADDRLTAEVNLGAVHMDQGRVDEAMQRFDAFIDVYNRAGGRLTASDLVAVGRAVRHLGRTNPALFQDSL